VAIEKVWEDEEYEVFKDKLLPEELEDWKQWMKENPEHVDEEGVKLFTDEVAFKEQYQVLKKGRKDPFWGRDTLSEAISRAEMHEEEYVSEDVDPEIRALVADLNSNGYKTAFSCAGHPPAPSGFISIKGSLDNSEIEDIQSIFRKYGISRVRVEDKDRGTVSFKFPSVSSRRTLRRQDYGL